jgi:hypothetical protein
VREDSPSNHVVDCLKKMHLICAILLFIANGPSGKGDIQILNFTLVKTFFSFVTIPYYIFIITQAQTTLVKEDLQFSEDSTNEEFTLVDDIYTSKKAGNTTIWIEIEVFAFYVNLFVCVLYLIQDRCFMSRNSTADLFSRMIVCEDKKDHETIGIHEFMVDTEAERQKLKDHMESKIDGIK